MEFVVAGGAVGQNSSDTCVRGIHFQDELQRKVRLHQDWGDMNMKRKGVLEEASLITGAARLL